MDRRDFLKVGIGLFSSAITFVLGWPFIASIIKLPFQKVGENYVKVPGFPKVPIGQPTKLDFVMDSNDAYLRTKTNQTIWVVKQSENKASVFSPICPHLSCRYHWAAPNQNFICPCHNSIFSENGSVMEGPAPRSLDTLPYKIIDGELYVHWELFKPGLATKEILG